MVTLMEVLKITAGAQQVSRVEQLIDFTVPILDLVRDTFPTYTLHNRVHAENVIKIMEQLLGPRISLLSGLEAEVLILSAYLHDIGMVFTEADKAEIASSQEFDKYLRSHPEEYLLSLGTADPNIENQIIEGFCRWSHADRVAVWLQRMPDDLLLWDTIPITSAITDVCRSHNWPTEKLKDASFDENYLGECDLRSPRY